MSKENQKQEEKNKSLDALNPVLEAVNLATKAGVFDFMQAANLVDVLRHVQNLLATRDQILAENETLKKEIVELRMGQESAKSASPVKKTK